MVAKAFQALSGLLFLEVSPVDKWTVNDEHADEVIKRYTIRNEWFEPHNLDMNSVATRLLERICEDRLWSVQERMSAMLDSGLLSPAALDAWPCWKQGDA